MQPAAVRATEIIGFGSRIEKKPGWISGSAEGVIPQTKACKCYGWGGDRIRVGYLNL